MFFCQKLRERILEISSLRKHLALNHRLANPFQEHTRKEETAKSKTDTKIDHQFFKDMNFYTLFFSGSNAEVVVGNSNHLSFPEGPDPNK